LIDFHHYLEEPINIRHLKEISLDNYNNHLSIILLSHGLEVPDDLSRFCASFELKLPDQDKLRTLIIEEARIWNLRNPEDAVKGDNKTLDRFIQNLTGLTESDARRLIRNAIYDDGAITKSDIPEVANAKYELLGQDGVLNFEYDTASFSEVGGFASLKRWLEIRKQHLTSNDLPLDRPKGILLLGVQGGGKSLAAKAVAGAWGVPLLRFDFGALYNKFFGETERNIRESLKAAQVMAPCVLWMDEIEKGIATGDYDSGTSRRVLATLLTWMAENKAPVFIVATANDIQSLPPELVRKGRFDEIFFVDLPSLETRSEIFAIHLQKRKIAPDGINFEELARMSEGFSGAEIEQAVVAAMYTAYAKGEAISTDHVVEEITLTRPLSQVMSEHIESLRDWASGRTVSAN
jgi:SpoVK/Ycf46/Vps4 family AAA+-type ATPase